MLNAKELRLDKAGFFRFRSLKDKVLLTNDAGNYAVLTNNDFENFIAGRLKENAGAYAQLSKQGFIRDTVNTAQLAKKFRKKNMLLMTKTSLHIMVLTLRCNFKCVYCQVSAESMKRKDLDMTRETAQKTIDFIFQTPNSDLTLEFQGGEPLVNWDVLTFSVDYALEKHKKRGGNLVITLVTNGSLLTKEKLDFLIDRRVSLCFSLDGPMGIHDKHRGKNYVLVRAALQDAMKAYKERFPDYMPAALPTVTRHSLPYAKVLVDEYVTLGLESIHLRPLTSLGFAREKLNALAYSADEYLSFYRQALERVIQHNKKGKMFMERYAWIFLVKILTDSDPHYLDICSPCGAGSGQLAYNHNGDIYTCDEGRMFSGMGDESFKCGNVFEHAFADILSSKPVRTVCAASCLDGLPECSDCAYKPYCGVCPVLNYASRGNVFTQTPNDFRCKIHKGILDLLFERLQDEGTKEIFQRWTQTV